MYFPEVTSLVGDRDGFKPSCHNFRVSTLNCDVHFLSIGMLLKYQLSEEGASDK